MSIPVEYGTMTEIQMQLDEVAEITSRIKEMSDDGLMVEWGSGGSSVKWLESMTGNQRLISIEHNPAWHMKVSGYINTRSDINNRFQYLFRPELYNYEHGYADIKEEHPHGLDEYLWPKAAKGIENAEIYFVDGIARATTAFIVKSLSQKPDPVIYIHDYFGREQWYSWSSQFFSKKEKVGQTLVRLWK